MSEEKWKLLIFDVDGTLTTTKSGEKFRKTADDWKWLPGRLEKCQELSLSGVQIALASNQAGVAFAWSSFSQADMQLELEQVAKRIHADYLAVCYSTPNPKALPEYFNANDPRRKPNPGMLVEAMEHFETNVQDTLMVGDRPEDEAAAANAGISFMWAKDFFGDEA